MCLCLLLFFFFKQKTAYEMRISDWSSDVCSSDLLLIRVFVGRESYCYVGKNAERIKDVVARLPLGFGNFAELADLCVRYEISGMRAYFVAGGEIRKEEEIGRASCRERVCPYG